MDDNSTAIEEVKEALEPAEEVTLFLETMIDWLAERPDMSSVRVLSGKGRLSVFEVCVEGDDGARLTGKGGRLVKAMETLMEAYGFRVGHRFKLSIASRRRTRRSNDRSHLG